MTFTDRFGGNTKERSIYLDGYRFDSRAESELYIWLKNEMEKGVYTELQCQDSIHLSAARFLFKPDFRVTLPSGESEWHEMKGFETDTWKRNSRLWKAGYGPFVGAKLTVWKKNRRGIYIDKVIVSKPVEGR